MPKFVHFVLIDGDFRCEDGSEVGGVHNLAEAGFQSGNIIATFRPAERAYLMHYSSKIARAEIAADEVPAMIGVDIDWVHETPAASRRAASAMVSSFNIVYPPALVSRHTARAAIDMSITGVVGKKIRNSTGEAVEIKALSDLNALGAKYGVYKLESDPPHWSDNGH